MNILIVGSDFKPLTGGVAEYTHQLASSLHKAGDNVIVLSERMKNDTSFDKSCPYTVYRHDFRFISSGAVMKYGKGYRWLKKFVKIHSPIDIIISNCREVSSVTSLAVSRALQIPFVIFTHGLEINRKEVKEKLMINLVLRGASRVICNSTFTQGIVRRFGVPKNRTAVVPGAIAVDEYKVPCYNSKNSHSADRKSRKEKIILTCGKLTERKGHDIVIKALPIILRKIGNVKYFIAGTGPYEMTLRALSRGFELQDRVVFRGRVTNSERRDLYKACDVFAMPCRELQNGDVEGFGLVFLEANAFCKPVVAGRSGGTADAVEHGKTGFLLDPLDVDQVADTIIYLMTHPKIAARMGRNGRRRVEREFTWDISGAKLRGELINLLE